MIKFNKNHNSIEKWNRLSNSSVEWFSFSKIPKLERLISLKLNKNIGIINSGISKRRYTDLDVESVKQTPQATPLSPSKMYLRPHKLFEFEDEVSNPSKATIKTWKLLNSKNLLFLKDPG